LYRTCPGACRIGLGSRKRALSNLAVQAKLPRYVTYTHWYMYVTPLVRRKQAQSLWRWLRQLQLDVVV